MSAIRHLIIGDVHGHFKNLRAFLIEQGAINEDNQRINKDELKVYCTGDLIDGGVNRMGDMLILEYAEEWFDKIVIGNHELPFFGGPSFMGLRSHDLQLTRKLLELEAKGVYVPSAVAGDYLLVHGGLSNRWSFQSAADANDVIHIAWRDAQESTKEVPMLDWIGPARAGKFADDAGGIFWLDWSEARNIKINQVVGHSPDINGPKVERYWDGEVEHWNIDVAGKNGYAIGGIIIEEGKPTLPVFWGERIQPPTNFTWLKNDELTEEEKAESLLNWPDDDDEEIDLEAIDLDDPENEELFRELMESVYD